MKSEKIGEIAKALAAAQREMDAAKKDSTNPFFKSKYADLSSVIDAIKEPLAKHGLSYTQYCEDDGKETYLITELMHTSGEWISGKVGLILGGKSDMQALGGALTYARRYSLSAIVGISQDDDDGQTAVGKPAKPSDKPSDADLHHLVTLTKHYRIPGTDVTAFIKSSFKKEKASELNMDEFSKTCHHFETLGNVK